jgi:hypothetical protein
LFGHTEYVIADADLAMSVQSSLLNDYAKNAPDPGIDIVDDLFENAFIDTVTGRIKLSGDLVENYPHLIDGAVTEELFHFLQLQAKNLIGKKLTPAQSVKMEAEVVLLMLNSGFKKL